MKNAICTYFGLSTKSFRIRRSPPPPPPYLPLRRPWRAHWCSPRSCWAPLAPPTRGASMMYGDGLARRDDAYFGHNRTRPAPNRGVSCARWGRDVHVGGEACRGALPGGGARRRRRAIALIRARHPLSALSPFRRARRRGARGANRSRPPPSCGCRDATPCRTESPFAAAGDPRRMHREA